MSFFGFMIILLTLFFGCSQRAPTVLPDSLEGNCVGVVLDASREPVKGALLMLVPAGHRPFISESGSGIDSTASDDCGRYGFTVRVPGDYNLLTKGNGLRAIRRSVRLSAKARIIMDDEILRRPGSLSGVVHLQGKTDHSGAVILLPGTNVYTKPSDSTGSFFVAALAEGSYRLCMLTAENDYVAAETTVTVASGEQTTLPCVELSNKFVPVIDSLSVRYDSAMGWAVLTWRAVDTAKITNYAVYCNRSETLAPAATVDKSATTISFDIIASPIDTFRYQISAFGKDGVEGPPAVAFPSADSYHRRSDAARRANAV